ncbi:conserved hypothetical protein [Talaromyces stipitatus ATCC 10500]|uniref:Uncharacterized protein n=1 Tax=Talaromyces stipitatus (strain ATCC 10500 / CBS 375.48 / QM 6759 / NRRL 1006) TaxID=441959 RepID=B8LTJ3_TALSN|nr:uncharacterized protein TSTA_065270 [Talaromyces stipitatus ATCC 10500]EED23071.1 conserved hypothetical protein [Talaromyces stipitatus ATCC 10500]
MTSRDRENQFIFVGGPLLRNRGGPIRSRILRRARRERVDQQRSAAAAEIESLLREATTNPPPPPPPPSAVCTCRVSDLLESAEPGSGLGYRQLMPKEPADPGTVGGGHFCSTCGRYKMTQDQRASLDTASVIPGLGTGNADPVIRIDESTSEFNVQEVLHFAATEIWAHFRPLDYSAACYRAWTAPYDDKVMLYAILWSTTYHQDVLRITYGAPDFQTGSKSQFRLKGLALQTLREAISTYTGTTPIDSIIMCVLFLAVNDSVSPRLYRDPSPFTPVFTGLHALDIYGSRDYHALHWTVVHDLIERFGGILSLRTFALSWLLSVADIMRSAHTIQKPAYPPMGVNGEIMNLDPPLALFPRYRDSFATNFDKSAGKRPGSGFDELLLSLKPPVRQEIVTAFAHVGELSHILQYFSEESCSPKALDLLGDSRDFVHNRLFSLPDENDPIEQILQLRDESADRISLSREIYLSCRHAAILYAIHVTYPIPRSAIVRGPLLQSLCPRLQLLADQGITGPLLLWCTSVVVIAMDLKADSPNRMMIFFWKLCRDLRITDLETLLRLLRSFAWMDVAIEHHYRGMWRDLDTMRQADLSDAPIVE